MAHKKLKLEVELETSKAKRQAREIAGGAAMGDAIAPRAMGDARAVREIRELGDAARGAKVNVKEVTRAFAGMAVGMAANYAAKSVRPGAARDALEYGGAAVTGASMGMVAGPIGAAVGAIGGILKTYLDREGTKKQATADFMRGEQDYASARAFKKTLESLTEVGDGFENLVKNIDETRKQLEHYRQVEQDLISKVKQFRKKGDEESAKLEEGYLGQNRGRQEALENVLKGLEKQQKDGLKGTPRIMETGTDALARVGGVTGRVGMAAARGATPRWATPRGATPPRPERGGFGFSVPATKMATMTFGGNNGGSDTDRAIKAATEASQRLQTDMLEVLKQINSKEGGSWQ